MKKVLYAVLAMSPALAMAQQFAPLNNMLVFIAGAVRSLIPIMFGLAIIFFFWGMIQFLRAAGDVKMKEQGRNHMIWGIIAIAVMLSVYGLTTWLQTLFGVTSNAQIPVPSVLGL